MVTGTDWTVTEETNEQIVAVTGRRLRNAALNPCRKNANHRDTEIWIGMPDIISWLSSAQ